MPYTVKKTFEQVAAAGAHVIAQVKANQPTLHQRVAELCQRTAPLDQTRTADQKQRSRDEIRVVEVFAPGPSLADTEWADHVAAVVRVSRDTLKRVTTTGLWEGTSEVAYFIPTLPCPPQSALTPSVAIGGSRTGCTMPAMSASARTTVGSAATPASSLACDPSP